MVEAAGVEPASETILNSGHPQVCLDFFGVQNSYPQISLFLCGLGNPPAKQGTILVLFISVGPTTYPILENKVIGNPAIKQLVRNCMQRYR